MNTPVTTDSDQLAAATLAVDSLNNTSCQINLKVLKVRESQFHITTVLPGESGNFPSSPPPPTPLEPKVWG